MKKLYPLLLVAIIFAGYLSEAHAQGEPRVGLGIGLSNSNFSVDDTGFFETVLSPVSIYVPITLSSLRVEPEIGIFRLSNKSDGFESTTTIVQLGAGVFMLRPVNDTNLYAGGRAGITRLSASFDGPGGDGDDSSVNLFVGPAVGAEYLFDEHFSLGGEAQVLYTSIGDESGDDDSSSIIRTRGVFFIRCHL